MSGFFFAAPPMALAWGTLRPAAFADRVAAAAAAGFPAIGLAIPDYLSLRQAGWDDDEMQALLDDHGVRIDEVEVIFGFSARPGPAGIPERPGLFYADPEIEAAAMHMADVFGVRHLQAVGTFDDTPVGPEVISAFAQLCDRAAVHNLGVALEFVPYTNIKDVRTASRIVESADRPNGGLCVDSWHFFRGSASFEDLERVPAHRIFMIQVNDGPAVPADTNRMHAAVHDRLCPGEGEYDLVRFLSSMDRPGLDATVSVEIYADRLHRMPSVQAAGLAYRSARTLTSCVEPRSRSEVSAVSPAAGGLDKEY
jgi:sugar phosphate isomerase/epimerase